MPINSALLFHPFPLNRLMLRNRIVMAPMTRNFCPGGVPGPDVAAYYRRRAESGVGLILTEGTLIDHPAAGNSESVPRFFGADALAGWSEVVKAVHAVGGKIMPQLWHVGAIRQIDDLPNPGSPPVGPSGLSQPGVVVGLPMTIAEIDAIVSAFAKGAEDAKRLGFDGVELHGGHGFLIDQFFWDGTNQRNDAYGGDLRKRTQFAVEVIRACRQAVGPEFPILLRFSQWKSQDYSARLAETPAQLEAFLGPLVDAGIDLFDCSTRRYWEPAFEGSPLTLAGWTRKLSGRPTLAVGSVGLDTDMFAGLGSETGRPPSFLDSAPQSLERVIDLLVQEEFDLVGVGRALLRDYAWARKVHDGRFDELLPFTRAALENLS